MYGVDKGFKGKIRYCTPGQMLHNWIILSDWNFRIGLFCVKIRNDLSNILIAECVHVNHSEDKTVRFRVKIETKISIKWENIE